MSEPSKPYDLFISYAQEDRAWVEGYLLDALTQVGVRCHSEAAFELGAPRLLEFERAVLQSQRTLLVLSPAYLAEGHAQFTDLLAQTYGVETGTWPVIPLILHAVQLPPRLSMLIPLDATDPGRWEEAVARLCATLQRPGPGPAPRSPCPYPGMVPFSAKDARFFYGRESEIQQMVQHLRHQRRLFVIGPSGCGKSSLMSAGLLPQLASGGHFPDGYWLVREMRPGEAVGITFPLTFPVSYAWVRAVGSGGQPWKALSQAICGDPTEPAKAVSALLELHPPSQRLLLVIDQFEELFAQAELAQQRRFIAALQALGNVQNCVLLIAMSADFYPDLMSSDLWPVPSSQRLEIAPLRGEALRQAIQGPAEAAGVYLEAGLVERLLADARDEPGVLPAVQETMVLLWERMARRMLPLSAYERLGRDGRSGLAVALATKADATLAALSPAQEAIARRIFLRLVQFGEGRLDTRRQQSMAALRSASDDPGEFDRTLEHLARNRLLTLSGEERGEGAKVDLAHEALITGWPSLQEWVRERREAEMMRRRLQAKAEEWEQLGQSRGGLLDEVELQEAQHWLESTDAAELGCSETLSALVQVSRSAIEQEKLQQRRTVRFRQSAIAAIGVLIIGVLATLLWSMRRDAQSQSLLLDQQQSAASTARAFGVKQQDLAREEAAARAQAEAERNRAEQQARVARTGQLAAQAQAALDQYPQRSLLLAVEAMQVTAEAGESRVAAAEQALRQALSNSGGRVLRGHEDIIYAVNISPDGHWLVTGSWDRTVRLWDLTAADPATAPVVLRGHDSDINAVATSPDGHWLATGSADNTARLWDLTAADPAAAPIVLRGHEDWILAVAFSPDGRWLVTGSADNTARLWDLTAADPAGAPKILRGHGGRILAVAVDPDGRWVVTGSADGTARLWDLTVVDPAAAPTVLRGHEGSVYTVAVHPRGRWLVTGSGDGTARLWDLVAANPAAAPVVLRGHDGSIWAVAISPDGHWLVTASGDNTARLWDLTVVDPAAKPIVLRGHEDEIATIAIHPDSHWLVTGGRDHIARLWDLTAADPAAAPIVLRGHEGTIWAAAFSADGHWLVTASWDRTARLWDLTTTDLAAAPIILRGHEDNVRALAISPDGRWLVTGSWDHTARLWDLTAANPAAAPVVLSGHEDIVHAVAIDPDGHWLVTGGDADTALLWNLTAAHPGAAPVVLPGHEDGTTAVAISPDGHWLVTGSRDSIARLWDLTAANPAAAPIVLRGHENWIQAVAFSPDGRWLVTGSWDKTARLWDLTAADPAAVPFVLRGHDGYIDAVVISADGHWLITGSWDNQARRWDLTAADPAAAPTILHGYQASQYAVAISPDAHWLVRGSLDNTGSLWDLTADAAAAPTPIVLRGHENIIYAIAISADSHWLVTASGDETARLWDLAAEDPAAAPVVLRGHEDAIWAVAISPDGHWLITGSDDGTARVWNLRLDELIDLACRTAGRNLTRREWEQYFPGEPYRKTCLQWPEGN